VKIAGEKEGNLLVGQGGFTRAIEEAALATTEVLKFVHNGIKKRNRYDNTKTTTATSSTPKTIHFGQERGGRKGRRHCYLHTAGGWKERKGRGLRDSINSLRQRKSMELREGT